MEFSVYGKKFAKILAKNLSLFFYFLCYRQIASIFTFFFKLLCQIPIFELLSLNRNGKVTFDNCGTQTTNLNLVRHRKRCSVGTFYCNQCSTFSTKSKNYLNYHIAKKHSAPKPDVTFKCKLCYQEFPGFYALRQHRNSQHGMQIGSRRRDVNVEHIVGGVEDHRFREELRSCQHFLVDPNLKGRETKYSITQWKLSSKQS